MSITKTAPMRSAPALLFGALALLAAGCGGSSHRSSQPTAVIKPGSTTAATTTAATTGAPPTNTSTPSAPSAPSTPSTTASGGAAVAGGGPCRAAQLSLTFLGGQGATGHGELGFALRNTSQQTCSTVGYPGIQFLDKAGQPLPTQPTHTTQDFFGSVPEQPLTLPPGATASFRLGVTHGAASPSGCTTAYGLQVIPPNDTASLRTAIPGGAYECQTATVSPLARGTSAYT